MALMALTALPYAGGKSHASGRLSGPWVASMLPYDKGYAELCGGMASVLINRKPSQWEIFNDRDRHIYNWWRMVREQPEELQRRLDATPHSEDEYRWACQAIEEFGSEWADEVEYARCISVLLGQGFVRTTRPGTWLQPSDGRRHAQPNIAALAKRMYNVTLYNRCALKILEHLGRKKDFVIYLDPPYQSSERTNRHYQGSIDYEALKAAMLAQTPQNQVAISGYDKEWDELLEHGWFKNSLPVKTTFLGTIREKTNKDRIESLWTSYQPKSNNRQETGSLF